MCVLDDINKASERRPVIQRHTEGPEVKGAHEARKLAGSCHACAINAWYVEHERQMSDRAIGKEAGNLWDDECRLGACTHAPTVCQCSKGDPCR